MKLYTEEQVRKMLLQDNIFDVDDILDSQIPIELPTDEEIEEYAVLDFPFEDNIKSNLKNMLITDEMIGFEIGAKWMRDKIQGGNQ